MRFIPHILLLLSVFALETGMANTPDADGKKKKGKKGETEATEAGKQQDAKLQRLLLEAEKAKVIEDWDNAIKSYQDVISANPYNSNAHFQLAQIYAGQNKMREAEEQAAVAIKIDNTNKWYFELLANIYMNQGKVKEAEETYKSLIAKFPNNPDYYLNLGFLYSKLGQFDNAIKTYDQFEKSFGVDEQVIGEKKNLYLRMGKFNEAVAEVKKLQEAFPGETDYMMMEAELYRAKRMKDKAVEIYKRVLELEPDNPHAQLGMAEINMQADNGADKQQNLKEIFRNPKVNVDTKVSILLISFIQTNSEDPVKRKEAIELADLLVNVHPEEAKAFAIQGDLYYIDEQYDKALGSYQRALEMNKDVFQVWQQVLAIYNFKKDWANLLKTSNEAMELFPNQAMIYLFRGGAEIQTKEYEKALKSFSRGEKMSGDNLKLRAQFLANQGDAYHSLGKNMQSDSAYEKSLKLDPENSYVLNNYSYYLSVRKENLERAKQMSAYSNKLDPDNNSFLDTYAWILFQLGDFSGAKEWQEKAMKAGGDKSGTILEHYGDILFKLNKKDEAVEYWRKAKELGTDSGTIEKKIAEQKYFE